jgi:chloramphenicol O-acetyltransferase type A
MQRILNLENWNRKDHFEFFSRFEEPFFGVAVTIDCTTAYQQAKEAGTSFFLYYLFRSLVAANRLEPFRYRIRQNEVVVYDGVHASPTINRPDGTFGFAYLTYYEEESSFYEEAVKEVAKVQSSKGLIPALSGENVIHYSALPWLNFTAISHARAFAYPDSCPKITFGKMKEEGGRRTMPFSIHVHHALMDGYHVGQYVELFQELMNQP